MSDGSIQHKKLAIDSMHLELKIVIAASRDRVFRAFTRATALWWGAPYLVDRHADDLVLEARVGGRFYESWDGAGEDTEGALLGTVVAIKKPELIKFQGSFGLSQRVGHGVVSIHLKGLGHETEVVVVHQAIGEIDDEVRHRYAQGWQDLLDRLKAFVEMHRTHGIRHDPSLDD
jgi:uncharacterized protein YndB with AHSA1/START domain